jgi:uncharacterized protein
MITVRVHPRASRGRTAWKGEELEVWVTAAPVDGAANEAVLKAVAKELGVPVSALVLRSGARGRVKLVEVNRQGGAASRPARRPFPSAD